MKFEVKRKQRQNQMYYPKEDFEVARRFAREIYNEFGEFIKGIVLFGSATQKVHKLSTEKDVDILVIIDDVKFRIGSEIIQTYRIILDKLIFNIDPHKLHVQTMTFTSFWEYVRAGDPVAINILRYGISLIDTGFFDPLQELLDQGRIRPSRESVYTYFVMAPESIARSKRHLLAAMVDLYWATIDSAHAALMITGEIPPSPEHVADMLDKDLVKKGYISKKCVSTMSSIYKIFKDIEHRNIKEINGKDYDRYKYLVRDFVKEMQGFIENRKKI
ncbi:MAG: nucleotidyltransferase domain-containing protein [Candidatus Nanoarchaeia archaeon]|nr:nucleotidyltransferase domain-containing protein [Candidatus Nanoarchaeia archaeon]